MAKDGYKVFDSDLHIMEPVDLWQRYMDSRYRDQAPMGLKSTRDGSSDGASRRTAMGHLL